ncbi:phosphatase PAP2 family protein [uncultured Demequina sp.]|mgnify:CR=1 FL=1|uniref:phosphatase PAP2 family protein n=1 Tax=uncultured Demequina sp. TaxID=693499 RepID=UPI0025F0E485|nr:phosphatase PAP2 family protein [uncultured Demequina sp.]
MRRVWDRLPALVRALVPGLIVSGLGLWGFLEILDEVLERDTFERIDQPLLEWFAEHRTDGLTAVMEGITVLFGPVVLPILVGVGCLVWWRRSGSWRDPALLVGAMIVSTLLSVAIKATVARPRPAEEFQVVPGQEASFSFPSGHSTGTATLVLVAAYLLWRRHRGKRALVAFALGSVALIGLVATTRLYLGYHFLSDVLAGACLGLFTLGLVISADRWLDLRRE